jgi:O-antigen chain-terminating methyltransferase
MKKVLKRAITKTFPGIEAERARLRQIEAKVDSLSDAIEDLKEFTSHHDTRLDDLKNLLDKVEPYQPLYGLSGIIAEPRRASADRCKLVEKHLGDVTGLRMLDIGSSLGFVPYYFADRGATVEGWDSTLNNVEVSRVVGDLNGVQGATFKFKEFNEDTVKTITGGEFDVAFILSVFHHIIYFQGLEKTKELVAELFERVPVLVVELAKKGEDSKLKWDKAQPEDELEIFKGLDVDIKKIGDFHNHLSEKTRPLYIVTRKKEVMIHNHRYSYDSSTQHAYDDSAVAAMGIRRRYYSGKDIFVKEYSFDKKSKADNAPQIMSEVALLLSLQKSASVHNLPEIVDFEFTRQGAKIAIRAINGTLALDAKKSTKKDIQAIASDLLQTLADLEEQHIYHNDIRSWNVIIAADSAWLIDYGLASSIQLEDNKVSLLWTLQAIISGEHEEYAQKKIVAPKRELFDEMGMGKVYDVAMKKSASFKDMLASL